MSKWYKEKGFKNKAELQNAIRSVVKNASLNEPLRVEDEDFMLWVFSHHHHFNEKVGCGLSHIEVRKNPIYNNYGFWFVRVDGSDIDISWTSALAKDGGKTPHQDCIDAMRFEIHYQIDTFKNTLESEPVCYLCGGHITTDLHIDHVNHFKILANDFINTNGYPEIEDKGLYSTISDNDYRNKWQQYHKENAILKPTHKICNLKRAKA